MTAHNRQKQSGAFSYGEFVWWIGVVEDRNDPEKLGRVRVRIFGYHTKDKNEIPTDKLPWATPIFPVTSASISGLGYSPTFLVEGTHVVGFFADGNDAQFPIIIGSLQGRPIEKKTSEGFFDPNGKYPTYPLEEQDSNRLARNEKISETIVQKRKSEVITEASAFGKKWNEKSTPYNAKYPFNHVYESECHHVQEFDDTQGAERYLLWHKSGTFNEIHPEGTTVNKIKKDKYEIIYGDNFVSIKGECTVTIHGNSHLLVKGNANIEINGNCREHIHGNYDLKVDGNFDLKVGGHQYSHTGSHEMRVAPRIDLNP